MSSRSKRILGLLKNEENSIKLPENAEGKLFQPQNKNN